MTIEDDLFDTLDHTCRQFAQENGIQILDPTGSTEKLADLRAYLAGQGIDPHQSVRDMLVNYETILVAQGRVIEARLYKKLALAGVSGATVEEMVDNLIVERNLLRQELVEVESE